MSKLMDSWLGVLMFIVGIGACCILAYLLALATRIDGLGYLADIQRGLDKACGVGKVKAYMEHFYDDPEPSWMNGRADCYRGDGGFVCNCHTP
jgi:hypothetical protein